MTLAARVSEKCCGIRCVSVEAISYPPNHSVASVVRLRSFALIKEMHNFLGFAWVDELAAIVAQSPSIHKG